jgi:hypothetical protein
LTDEEYPPAPGFRCGSLSLFSMICVKELFMLDRAFPFYRPERCLREGCKSTKIWGHGFVLLCIEGYAEPLPFRRWRCPICGCVYTIRPCGYWSRHSAPVWTISEALRYRLTHGFWNKTLGPSRQKQGHWLRALKTNIKAHLGMDFSEGFMEGFSELISRGLVPVFRFG